MTAAETDITFNQCSLLMLTAQKQRALQAVYGTLHRINMWSAWHGTWNVPSVHNHCNI